MQHFHRRFAAKRRVTSEQVIKNRAETVDIGCRSDTARIGRLFRRHVVRRAKNRERLREIAFALQPFRETEVAHVRFVSGIEKNICGFQIAMQNAVLVRIRDRAGKLRDQVPRCARFVAIVVDSRGERPAFRELHAVKRRAVVLADGVNRQNAFVFETRRRFRFGAETLDRTRRIQMRRQNHFQRDDARRRTLPGSIHDAHSAARYFVEQLVIFDATAAGVSLSVSSTVFSKHPGQKPLRHLEIHRVDPQVSQICVAAEKFHWLRTLLLLDAREHVSAAAAVHRPLRAARSPSA